ncbi:MFS transporter [Albimonas pacifica]|nr:MFS transporter [Albimonas pacifica]
MLFDWAAQPYHTLIITFIFAPYFASAVAPNPILGQEMWAWAASAGGLVIALTAPILGALADATGPRKPWIAGFSVCYALGSALLWLSEPGAADPVLVLAFFVLGLIGVEYATVFTNAMLPDLAPRDAVGRLSGDGWALGYVGGVVSLAIMLLLLAENEQGVTLLGAPPALGLDPATREGTRAVGPLTAAWYLVFVLPLFLWVPDAPRRGSRRGALARGLAELKADLKALPARRSLAWFLGASMIYRDALNGFYVFGGVYAAGVLGWSVVEIGVFGILAAVVGALGAWLGGMADHARGPKPVVAGCLVLLILFSAAAVSASREAIFFWVPVDAGSNLPDILFYIAGAGVGGAGGALQAASRTLLVRQADAGRMTAAFGLYALAGKATAFLAPLAVAVATGVFQNQQAGAAPVIGLFLLGLLMLAPVDPEGER